jgi:5-bromo-4-chloroindolyl phosphate hydrolysis protein
MPAKFWRKRQIAMKEQYSSDYEEGHADGWDAAMESFPQKQREWVGLTDEDWDYIEKNCGSTRSAIKTAEALLKEKNHE